MVPARLRTALTGFVAGLLAYAGGFGATYLATSDALPTAEMETALGELGADPATYRLVGWAFYNLHGVAMRLDAQRFDAATVDFVAASPALSDALYLLPPAVLVLAGAFAARVAGADDRGAAAWAGTAVTLGYLPACAFVAYVFVVIGAGTSVGPDLTAAFFLAGLASPAAFGTLGGVLAHYSSRATISPHGSKPWRS